MDGSPFVVHLLIFARHSLHRCVRSKPRLCDTSLRWRMDGWTFDTSSFEHCDNQAIFGGNWQPLLIQFFLSDPYTSGWMSIAFVYLETFYSALLSDYLWVHTLRNTCTHHIEALYGMHVTCLPFLPKYCSDKCHCNCHQSSRYP